jgi:hypothetical protein
VADSTTIAVKRELATWMRSEAERRGMTLSEYLRYVTAMPPMPKGAPGIPRKGWYRFVSETLLATLAAHKGEMRAGDAQREVASRIRDVTPVEWQLPADRTNYPTRAEMIVAWRRKDLEQKGLISSEERGMWRLTPRGFEQANLIQAAGGPARPAAAAEAGGENRTPRTYKEAVATLAEWQAEGQREIAIFCFPDPREETVRLVEVSPDFPDGEDTRPFRMGRSPEFPFASDVILISPQDWMRVVSGELQLPPDWDLRTRMQVWPR